MRLNKLLSEMGIMSRRQADSLMNEGRITVNGIKALPGTQAEETDIIELDGKRLKRLKTRNVLLAYNKPRGVVSSLSDKDRARSISDAVSYPERVYPIGRLDKDSEGLILLTNDGSLAEELTKVSRGHEKEYVVTVEKPLTREFLQNMADGVYLKELKKMTLPCEVWQDLREDNKRYTFHIVLKQGLNRQIRRMAETLGNRVRRLKRVRIDSILLDELKPGEWKEIEKYGEKGIS